MKIYTNEKEYNDALKYWSNACGELHYHGERDINEDELPDELKDVYNRLWTEGSGSYCYLAEYNGEYGLAIINEYHECTEEGRPGGKNNYEQAVKVAKILEKKYPYTVFIGKKLGFPMSTEDGDNDYATELVVFAKTDEMSKDQFDEVTDWLYKNGYIDEIEAIA